MDLRAKNEHSYTQHFKGLFLIKKTECVYSAVRTGFLSNTEVKFPFENLTVICAK